MLGRLSLLDAIALYYEKHHAIRHGNLVKILELQTNYPEIFDPKIDAEIQSIIQYAKSFQNSQHYKALCRQQLKEKLLIIKNE